MVLDRHHQPGSVTVHLGTHGDHTIVVLLAHLTIGERRRNFTDPGTGLVTRGSHDTGCLTLA